MARNIVEVLLEIPQDAKVEVKNGEVMVSGKKGLVKKAYDVHSVSVSIENGKLKIIGEKMFTNTLRAHVKNMFKGSEAGFIAKLKSLHAHFPMELKVEGEVLVIKNFLGEKIPRKARLINTKAQIKGQDLVLESLVKEDLGQTISNIKNALRKGSRDLRVFQDGLYVIERN